MNKWMLIPAMVGIVTIGGVAMASDSVPANEISSNQLISLKEAKEIAAKKVGGVVTEIELERKGSAYVYEVDAVAKGIEYELKVDAVSREVVIVEQSSKTKWTDKMITEEQAVAIAKGKVNAVVTDIELDKDNKRFYYEIELKDEKFEYEVKVNAITGEIIKFSKEDLDDNKNAQSGKVMTMDEAIVIAKTKAKGAVKEIELDKDDGRMIYDIEMKDEEFKYEIELDAVTGEFLKFEKERFHKVKKDVTVKAEKTKVADHTLQVTQPASDKDITKKAEKQNVKPTEQRTKLTKDQALAIAKQHASGVVTDFELDDNVYEIEMEDGDIEYDLEIDAYTGAILSFERDED